LTDTPLGNFNATLPPDGQQAVYVVSDGKSSEIHEHNVNTGRARQLTDLKQNAGSPEISPDNQLIIFHYREGNGSTQL